MGLAWAVFESSCIRHFAVSIVISIFYVSFIVQWTFCSSERNPFLFLIAVHHIHSFIFHEEAEQNGESIGIENEREVIVKRQTNKDLRKCLLQQVIHVPNKVCKIIWIFNKVYLLIFSTSHENNFYCNIDCTCTCFDGFTAIFIIIYEDFCKAIETCGLSLIIKVIIMAGVWILIMYKSSVKTKKVSLLSLFSTIFEQTYSSIIHFFVVLQ